LEGEKFLLHNLLGLGWQKSAHPPRRVNPLPKAKARRVGHPESIGNCVAYF
jgi:hypothetical protein